LSKEPVIRELEHTGDLAIEVIAASREELFAHALIAMARLMVEPEAIEPCARREIRLAGDSNGETLRDLLAAALNVFLIESFIWREVEVTTRNANIVATLVGEKFDPMRHCLLEEIKAVTYHRLLVEQTDAGRRAIVVFDA
jgi:SHS2 domain-containing protein